MPKILFVGTDSALTDMTGRLLERNGFDVRCAVGAQEGLDAMRSDQIAVIIADLEAGSHEISGFCREVKQFSRAIKLLLISENEEDEIPFLNSGADDWIKKPCRMKVLYTRIKVLLRQK